MHESLLRKRHALISTTSFPILTGSPDRLVLREPQDEDVRRTPYRLRGGSDPPRSAGRHVGGDGEGLGRPGPMFWRTPGLGMRH